MNNAKQAIVRKVNDKIIIFPEPTAQNAVRAVSLRRGYYSAQLFTPGKSRGRSRIFRSVVSGGGGVTFDRGEGGGGCMGGSCVCRMCPVCEKMLREHPILIEK